MSIQGPLSAQLSLYARYSLWATKRLLGAASLLQDYLQKDIALPFKSVRGTLNHMVCADTVWFARLRPQAALPLDPLKIARLWEGETDAGQWDSVEGVGDFHNAAEEFVRFAERWIALVGSMNEDDLAGSFEYRHRSGIMRKQVVSEMLLHIFNHHTHHRGQISAGLAILARKVRAKSELPAGFKVPAIDLLYFVEEEKHKLAATGSD